MEAIKCIKTRRSRRKFLNKKIARNIVIELIDCAISAPSSQDCQPWHFVIVQDLDLKQKLAKLKDTDNQQHILTAPLVIMVCVDIDKSSTRWIEDGVIATENILLAAHSMGLGAVYVTGYKATKPDVAEAVRGILNLPENIMPITILPIGYADPLEKLDEKKLININEIIHYDKW